MWRVCKIFKNLGALQKSDVFGCGNPRLAAILLISAKSITELADAIAFL